MGLLHLVDEQWKSEAMLREFWVLDPPVEPQKIETQEFYALQLAENRSSSHLSLPSGNLT